MRNVRLAVLAVWLGLSACSAGYNRDRAIEDLMDEAEIERPIAVCIIDAVEGEFGVERLRCTGGLTETEEAVLDDISLRCLAASGGARG